MSCLKNNKNITFIDTGYYIYWHLGGKYFIRDITQFPMKVTSNIICCTCLGKVIFLSQVLNGLKLYSAYSNVSQLSC